MQRFGQLFLTILMVVSLVLIPLKKHWFEIVDRTFVFDNSQQKFNIKEIAVVGDFSNWQKWYYMRQVRKNKWAITIPLKIGTHRYRFVINNRNWIKDPTVKDYDGPFSNSKIIVDTLTWPEIVKTRPATGSWLFSKSDSITFWFDKPLSKILKFWQLEVRLDSQLQNTTFSQNRLSIAFSELAEGEHRCNITLIKKSDPNLNYQKEILFFFNLKNQSPISDAGHTQIAFVNEWVILNGGLSFDPDFEPLVKFQWKQLSGPHVKLLNANTPFARFQPTRQGHYRFQLTVADSFEAQSTDPVDLWVLPAVKKKEKFSVKFNSLKNVKSVSLVGEFNNWSANKTPLSFDSLTGKWVTKIILHPGVWEYKFVVNNKQWLPDPQNPERVSDGWQGFNSVRRVAANPMLEGRFVEQPLNNKQRIEIIFLPDSQSNKTRFHWFADINNPYHKLRVNKNRLIFNKNWPAGHYYYYLVLENQGQWSEPQSLLINHFEDTRWMDLRQTPAWADTSVFYELFARKFTPQGNLQGVVSQLPYLEKLGVNVIWLMPVYDGPTEHGYAPTSLFSIEKDYGTLDDYRQLIEKAHQMGFKVIFDFVANHLSDQHRFVKAAAENPESPLRSWFFWKADGTWGYHNDWDTLVNLNYQSPWVRHYILNSALFWLNLGVDGFRCDVAWAIPHDFWKQFRRAVKQVNPQCLLLNEVLPRQRKFHDFEFDMSYDTDFYGNVLDVLNGRKPLSAIPWGLAKSVTNYPRYAQALRYLENHDLPRFNTQFSMAKVKVMTQLLFSLPGTPLVYYGQEYFSDQTRPTFFKLNSKKWFDFFQKRIKLRHQSEELRRGRIRNLSIDDESRFWAFECVAEADTVLVEMNLSKGNEEIKIQKKATN